MLATVLWMSFDPIVCMYLAAKVNIKRFLVVFSFFGKNRSGNLHQGQSMQTDEGTCHAPVYNGHTMDSGYCGFVRYLDSSVRLHLRLVERSARGLYLHLPLLDL